MMNRDVQMRCDRRGTQGGWQGRAGIVAVLLLALVAAGCASSRAFGRANSAAQAGEWDLAVEEYRRALAADPDNPQYRLAFQRALLSASIYYADQGRIAEARGDTENALRSYRRANEYDPTNRAVSAKVSELERRIRDQVEASQPRPTIQQLQQNAQQGGPPPLVRLNEVLPALTFTNSPVRDILSLIGDAAGINVTFERDYQEPRPGQGYSVQLDGLTLAQALNQIVTANGLFYKVVDQRTILIINDTQAKRLAYEDQVLQVLRVSHADANELSTMIQQLLRIPGAAQANFQVFANKTQNTITVRAPAAMAQIIQRLVEINDTPRAEVVVDVEILEVNRSRVKEYGLDLGNYTIGAVYSPEVDPRSNGTLTPQPFNADVLGGPLRRSDFYLAVPSAAVRFLERDSDTKILARPQLRGAEGEELTLNLGEEVPIPTTVFTPLAQGGSNFNPLSSFEYRTVGIVLQITPRVTFEDEIILELTVENSTRGQDVNISGSNLPTFSTREVQATLRLRDGEPNLLAGLIRESDRRALRGFPGILRLPVIRQLFSANETTIEQTDIIMLLTPRIIRTKEITQADVDALFIGTATNLGLGGPPPLIAPQAAPGAGQPGAAAPAPAQPGAAPAQPAAPPPPTAKPGAPAPAPPQPQPGAKPDAGAAGAAAGQVLLTPASTEFKTGSSGIQVPINITGASRLSNVALTVTYNPKVLRVRSVQQGGFMSSGGSPVAFTEDHSTPGRVDIVVLRTADSTGASGTGLLADLIFDAVAPGAANLSITGTAAAPGARAIPVQFAPVPPVVVK